MKKLEEIGLIPLSKKESVEHDGGTNPPIKLPDIFNDGTIWCCVDIAIDSIVLVNSHWTIVEMESYDANHHENC